MVLSPVPSLIQKANGHPPHKLAARGGLTNAVSSVVASCSELEFHCEKHTELIACQYHFRQHKTVFGLVQVRSCSSSSSLSPHLYPACKMFEHLNNGCLLMIGSFLIRNEGLWVIFRHQIGRVVVLRCMHKSFFLTVPACNFVEQNRERDPFQKVFRFVPRFRHECAIFTQMCRQGTRAFQFQLTGLYFLRKLVQIALSRLTDADGTYFNTVLLETEKSCGGIRRCTNDCHLCDTSEQDGCLTRNPWRRFRMAIQQLFVIVIFCKHVCQGSRGLSNSESVHAGSAYVSVTISGDCFCFLFSALHFPFSFSVDIMSNNPVLNVLVNLSGDILSNRLRTSKLSSDESLPQNHRRGRRSHCGGPK